jgi:benzil reductase ((S)-benzoin forming)
MAYHLSQLFPSRSDAQSFTLINNAGTLGEINYVGELAPAHFQAVFDLNVVVPAMLMNAFLSTYGHLMTIPRIILNISSGAAQRPVDGWAAYCASKAALNFLSETIQKEQDLRGSGVRVWALSPGVVNTAMQTHIRTAGVRQFSEQKKFVASHAERQLQTPAAVAARTIAWLDNPPADAPAIVRL